MSAPVPDGDWSYFSRTVEGQQYAIHCRRPRDGRRRAGPARRERARRGPRLLLARRLRGLPRPPPPRVLDRPHRRRAVHAPLPRPHHRHRPRPTSSTTSRTASPGPTTPARASTSAPTTRCARTRSGATARHRRRRRRARVRGGRRALLRRRRPDPIRAATCSIESSSKLTSETWFVPTDAPGSDAARSSPPREHEHEYTVEHHANDAHRRPLPDRHQRRRRPELQARAAPVADPGRDHWTEVAARTATTCASTRSTRSRDHLVLTRARRRPRPAPGDASRRRDGRRSRPPIRCTACGSGRTPSTTPPTCATATRRSSRP